VETLYENEILLVFLKLDIFQHYIFTKNDQEIISESERDAALKFRFPRDRHRYLLTRLMTRRIIGKLLDLQPKDLQFCLEENGKPRLDNSSLGGHDIRFNISHSKRLIVWGITRGIDIGVDTESFGDMIFPFEMNEEVFTASEIKSLSSTSLTTMNKTAYTLWTLKEALVKATGQGISSFINQFGFNLNFNGIINLHTPEISNIDQENWSFLSYQIQTSEIISVCIRKPLKQPEVQISWYELHSNSIPTKKSFEPIYKSLHNLIQ